MFSINGARIKILDKENGDNIETVKVNANHITFGSHPLNHFRLHTLEAERLHCKVFADSPNSVTIENYSKHNHILLNGVPQENKAKLKNNDVFEVAGSVFEWCFDSSNIKAVRKPEKHTANQDRVCRKKLQRVRSTGDFTKKTSVELSMMLKPVRSRKTVHSTTVTCPNNIVGELELCKENVPVELKTNESKIIQMENKDMLSKSPVLDEVNRKLPLTPQLKTSSVMLTSYTPVIERRHFACKTPISTSKKPPFKTKPNSCETPRATECSVNVSNPQDSMFLIDLTTPNGSSKSPAAVNRSFPCKVKQSVMSNSINLITPSPQKIKNSLTAFKASADIPKITLLKSAIKNSHVHGSSSKGTPLLSKIRTPSSKMNSIRADTPKQTSISGKSSSSKIRKHLIASLNNSKTQLNTGNTTPVLSSVSDVSMSSEYSKHSTPLHIEKQNLHVKRSIFASPMNHLECEPLQDDDENQISTKRSLADVTNMEETMVDNSPLIDMHYIIKKPNRITQVRSAKYSDITPHESLTDEPNPIIVEAEHTAGLADASMDTVSNSIVHEKLTSINDPPKRLQFDRNSYAPALEYLPNKTPERRKTVGTSHYELLSVSPISGINIKPFGIDTQEINKKEKPEINCSDGSLDRIELLASNDLESLTGEKLLVGDSIPNSPHLRKSLRDTRKFIGSAFTSLNTSRPQLDLSAEIDESLLIIDENETENLNETYDVANMESATEPLKIIEEVTLSTPVMDRKRHDETHENVSSDSILEISLGNSSTSVQEQNFLTTLSSANRSVCESNVIQDQITNPINGVGVQKHLRTPKIQKEMTENLEGLKSIFKTPRLRITDGNTSFGGVAELLNTPRITNEVDQPLKQDDVNEINGSVQENDHKIEGDLIESASKDVIEEPAIDVEGSKLVDQISAELNDSANGSVVSEMNFVGVRDNLRTPKVQKEMTENLEGLKSIFKTPRLRITDGNTSFGGVAELLNTPRITNELDQPMKQDDVNAINGSVQENDHKIEGNLIDTASKDVIEEPAIDVEGSKLVVDQISAELNDSANGSVISEMNFVGVRDNLRTPKIQKEMTENLAGLKSIFKTPRLRITDGNTSFGGVAELLNTPRITNEVDQPMKQDDVNEINDPTEESVEMIEDNLINSTTKDVIEETAMDVEGSELVDQMSEELNDSANGSIVSEMNFVGVRDNLRTPKIQKEMTENLEGLKSIFKTPRLRTTDGNTSFGGVAELLNTPCITNEVNQPMKQDDVNAINDPTEESVEMIEDNLIDSSTKDGIEETAMDVEGSELVDQMLEELNDSANGSIVSEMNFVGVRDNLRTPKIQKEITENLEGLKSIFKTPRLRITDGNTSFGGVAELLNAPRITNEVDQSMKQDDVNEINGSVQENDHKIEGYLIESASKDVIEEPAIDVEGSKLVDQISAELNDSANGSVVSEMNFVGVRDNLRTPKVQKEMTENLEGLKSIFKTPRLRTTDGNTSFGGVAELLNTPRITNELDQPLKQDDINEINDSTEESVEMIEDNLIDSTTKDGIEETAMDVEGSELVDQMSEELNDSANGSIVSEMNFVGVRDNLRTPKIQKEMTENLEGLKSIFKTPRLRTTDGNTSFGGVAELLNTPRITNEVDLPMKQDDINEINDSTEESVEMIEDNLIDSTTKDGIEETAMDVEGSKLVDQISAELNDSANRSVVSEMNFVGVRDNLRTPKIQKEMTENLEGLKSIFKTPRLRTTDGNTSFGGVAELLNTPRITNEVDQPLKQDDVNEINDPTEESVEMIENNLIDSTTTDGIEEKAMDVEGGVLVDQMLEELNDSANGSIVSEMNFVGVRDNLRTPKIQKEMTENLEGLKSIFKTPRLRTTDGNISFGGVAELLNTPRITNEVDQPMKQDDVNEINGSVQENDHKVEGNLIDTASKDVIEEPAIDVEGSKLVVDQISAELNDSANGSVISEMNFVGVRDNLRTPKTQKEMTENLEGLKSIFKTPRLRTTDGNTSFGGVAELLNTPRITNEVDLPMKQDDVNEINDPTEENVEMIEGNLIDSTTKDGIDELAMDVEKSELVNEMPEELNRTANQNIVPNTGCVDMMVALQTSNERIIADSHSNEIDIADISEISNLKNCTPLSSLVQSKNARKRRLYSKQAVETELTTVAAESDSPHRSISSEEYLNILNSPESKRNVVKPKDIDVPNEVIVNELLPERRRPVRACRSKIESLAYSVLAGASPELKYVKQKQITKISLTAIKEDGIQSPVPGNSRKVAFNEEVFVREINSPNIVGDVIRKTGRSKQAKKEIERSNEIDSEVAQSYQMDEENEKSSKEKKKRVVSKGRQQNIVSEQSSALPIENQSLPHISEEQISVKENLNEVNKPMPRKGRKKKVPEEATQLTRLPVEDQQPQKKSEEIKELEEPAPIANNDKEVKKITRKGRPRKNDLAKDSESISLSLNGQGFPESSISHTIEENIVHTQAELVVNNDKDGKKPLLRKSRRQKNVSQESNQSSSVPIGDQEPIHVPVDLTEEENINQKDAVVNIKIAKEVKEIAVRKGRTRKNVPDTNNIPHIDDKDQTNISPENTQGEETGKKDTDAVVKNGKELKKPAVRKGRGQKNVVEKDELHHSKLSEDHDLLVTEEDINGGKVEKLQKLATKTGRSQKTNSESESLVVKKARPAEYSSLEEDEKILAKEKQTMENAATPLRQSRRRKEIAKMEEVNLESPHIPKNDATPAEKVKRSRRLLETKCLDSTPSTSFTSTGRNNITGDEITVMDAKNEEAQPRKGKSVPKTKSSKVSGTISENVTADNAPVKRTRAKRN